MELLPFIITPSMTACPPILQYFTESLHFFTFITLPLDYIIYIISKNTAFCNAFHRQSAKMFSARQEKSAEKSAVFQETV